ncbi:aminoglycoside phosphotransferase family protein [Mycobacterium aquaticum]|uniref:Aminoglycoside phosphotransferase n=1 Tax=Mycobacterium aquaticum TaxID=1927124 RepID=A0A1X0AMT6_9MYCO|nr:aminoglycoside phosphotransferase family protein [Mycobacterium aquaticum]ORA31225.1 aminoglycoside phosphotransferase [Mycobacterium aquaticum]
MHPNQLTITTDMVRILVGEQFPQWRGLPIEQIASSGTVNALFRIGERLAARFPLESEDATVVRQRWCSEAEAARLLVGRTRFSTPEPIALGQPGAGYPLPWSVQTWVPGSVARGDEPGRSQLLARDLAEFIAGVRTIGTDGKTFDGVGRGGDLTSHDEWINRCLHESERLFDVAPFRRIWAELRSLPRESPDVMTHGDLIPGNVVVDHRRRLVGIIDVGGLGPADPALDLVCAWHLFDEPARRVLRGTLNCDDLEWERGKAWAFQQAMGLVWYYERSNPSISEMGRRTLHRIATD